MAFFDFISAGASIFNNERNINAQEDANQANWDRQSSINASNQQIAASNNAAAVDMWNKQTAYNSPTAQMTRLQSAGLNPNLVYGTMAESKMSNPPPLNTPDMQSSDNIAPRSLNALAEYQQSKNLQALNSNARIQNEKLKAETVSAAADASYKVYENNALQNSGTIKSDSPLFRNIGRGVDKTVGYGAGVIHRVTDPLFGLGRWLQRNTRLPEGNADERR